VRAIGNRHVGVHAAFEALGQFFEVVQVKPVILLGEKAGDTVVSPLNDVQGGRLQTSDARAVAFRYLAWIYLRIPRGYASISPWCTRA
jgi:hypothetical protein